GVAGCGKLLLVTNAAPAELKRLRSVQALYAFLCESDCIRFENRTSAAADLTLLAGLVGTAPAWKAAIRTWQQFFPEKGEKGDIGFRSSCVRDGDMHGFRSPDVNRADGAAVLERHAGMWRVNCLHFDVEVTTLICHSHVVAGLSLAAAGGSGGGAGRTSSQNGRLPSERHAPFMPSPQRVAVLRPSTAHLMLRLAWASPRQFIVDDMAGVATIPNLSSLAAFAASAAPGSDLDAAANAAGTAARRRLGVAEACRWDARCLPLRDAVADAFVVDFPFGMSCGSTRSNQRLYPLALREMARVLRSGGRAVLLCLEPLLI
ncbi:unnamed protein product, partial [Phaeothamnion confervicola]